MKGPPEDKLALYEKVVASLPGVERKGASNPYTSLNGHMFSRLDPSGRLSLRLPADEREKFLKKYFELSLRYAQTLKPKQSKKSTS